MVAVYSPGCERVSYSRDFPGGHVSWRHLRALAIRGTGSTAIHIVLTTAQTEGGGVRESTEQGSREQDHRDL